MSITIEAMYEDGVLKPMQPLPLTEHTKVRMTIDEDAAWRSGRVRATYGLLGWKGDAEALRRVALDSESRKSPAVAVDGPWRRWTRCVVMVK